MLGVTNLAILDDKTVVNTRLQHFEHLRVLHVIANVLKNISVGNNTQRAKNNPDWYVDFDVRYCRLQYVSKLCDRPTEFIP